MGHMFLLNTLGVKPTVAWQLDPFGHSNTNTRLAAEMGFEALFLARMDQEDRSHRTYYEHALEFIWKPTNESWGQNISLFTHVFQDHYSPPPAFRRDILLAENPNKETENDQESPANTSAETNTTDQIAANGFDLRMHTRAIRDYAETYQGFYCHNDVFILMGEDFTYENAEENFVKLDDLISYMNKEKEFKDKLIVKYSTPGEYMKSIMHTNISFPTKEDDMFPYSDGADSYWTGYFTSRPNDKSFFRSASSLLHS